MVITYFPLKLEHGTAADYLFFVDGKAAALAKSTGIAFTIQGATLFTAHRFFEQPIVNSPFQYATQQWESAEHGQPTQKIVELCHASNNNSCYWVCHSAFPTISH